MGDAPVVTSEGRGFPVDIRYRERPAGVRIEDAVAEAARAVLAERPGGVLCFLPGRREIARTAERLEGRLPADVDLVSLHGGLDARAQDAAIRPPKQGRRKLVLATAIAETSVTIDGVAVVIDGGLSRLPKYEPATGLTRLETVRVSRASADQRAGRAGRTAPGLAIRLWRREQTTAFAAFTPPEILEADLSGMLLDCAAFGVGDPAKLAFLDPPPAPALAEARSLLLALGALDGTGRLTAAGTEMRRLALPVRLAHMVAQAAHEGRAGVAAELAVLLTEQRLGGNGVDLERRLAAFRADRSHRAGQARRMAERLARNTPARDGPAQKRAGGASVGALLLHAYPDRVAKARGAAGSFLLANGRGGVLDPAEPLARERFLVVADLQGKAENARIAAAAAVSEDDIAAALGNRMETRDHIVFDPISRTLRARRTRRLGAVVLDEAALPAPNGAQADRAMLDAVREHGIAILPWNEDSNALRARLGWLRRSHGAPWPAMTDGALLESLEEWLPPFLTGRPDLASLAPHLGAALLSRVPHETQRRLDALAPARFAAPSGRGVPIRYEEDGPVLSIRVQELFGMGEHPAAGGTPLTLELLSPAGRPIQTTRDLPGFWRGSWTEVRAAMRGRYPKHDWPEDPEAAAATSRAKPGRK